MASPYVITPANITTFANLTVDTATTVNSTITELVTQHDALANSLTMFGNFSIKETVLAIRAGVLG